MQWPQLGVHIEGSEGRSSRELVELVKYLMKNFRSTPVKNNDGRLQQNARDSLRSGQRFDASLNQMDYSLAWENENVGL